MDVVTSGFWGSRHQKVFLDVKVFNPNASSYRSSNLPSLYCRLEKETQRKYEEHIREMEMGLLECFLHLERCPLFDIFYKRLASLLAEKKDVSCGVMMSRL